MTPVNLQFFGLESQVILRERRREELSLCFYTSIIFLIFYYRVKPFKEKSLILPLIVSIDVVVSWYLTSVE